MSRVILILNAILFFALVICYANVDTARTRCGVFDYDKARQVMTNLNRIRQSQNLKSLKMETSLTEAAMLRAAELAFRMEVEQEGEVAVEVRVAPKSSEKTDTVTRTKSDTDMTPTDFEVTGNFNYTKAIEVVELTNKERAANGLKPLIMDSILMERAMIRAAEMKSINKMTHTRPNGESGESIIDDFFYETGGGLMNSGENIAHGQIYAIQVVSQWMESPGHRRNILGAYYNRMGAGECDGYWVQLFVKTTKKSSVLPKSSGHIEEVTVLVTVAPDGNSKVLKRKRTE